MPVAARIRKILHQHGIHSSTIQPEYYHPEQISQVGNFKLHDIVQSSLYLRETVFDSPPVLSFARLMVVTPARMHVAVRPSFHT
jgi:hypothetical protein